jgi:RNA polymerase sigma-70 factor (ECF subfamily)
MSNHTEELLQHFADGYYQKLYFFCLKKVSGPAEAEDLAADIALCIIQALRKGTVPARFPAWVWKIARNKYAQWAAKKHKTAETFSPDEFTALTLAGPDKPDDELLRREDISLLRRELAFIAKEYRSIVVPYYIEYRSIKDIAASLCLPVGTVKAKLFRSRNILKEGMKMAREFGTLSYKPEHINFIMNGISGAKGEPWSIITKKMNKNILLAAYRTPSAAEELAMELGIALPYLEDELDELVQGEFLRKNGKKYETNFFIVSASTQEKVYANLRAIQAPLTNQIIALTENHYKNHDENGYVWHEGYQSYEDMKWAMLMHIIDEVSRKVVNEMHENQTGTPANLGSYGHTLRPNGGEWDLLGFEEYHGDRPEFVGEHGNTHKPGAEQINFAQFKFKYKSIDEKTPVNLTYEQAEALLAAANKDTSAVPQHTLDQLTAYGYLEKIHDTYKPTFWVSFKSKIGKPTAEQEKNREALYREAHAIAIEHYKYCRNLIYREIPDFFKDDQYQIDHACANIFNMRGAVLEGALGTGYIRYEEGDGRRMLGAYLVV